MFGCSLRLPGARRNLGVDLLSIEIDSTWTAGCPVSAPKTATFQDGAVQKGQAYVELEAMKMVMPLKAPGVPRGRVRFFKDVVVAESISIDFHRDWFDQ